MKNEYMIRYRVYTYISRYDWNVERKVKEDKTWFYADVIAHGENEAEALTDASILLRYALKADYRWEFISCEKVTEVNL